MKKGTAGSKKKDGPKAAAANDAAALPEFEVVKPEDVADNTDLKLYFRQRLGADFDDLPSILMSRDAYLDLIHGGQALLSEMLVEDEEAANEIFIAYAGDKQNRVVMTLHIETATTGNRVVDFIKAHKRTPDHENWLTEMQQLAFKMQKLHRQWKRQSVPYHPIEGVRRRKTV